MVFVAAGSLTWYYYGRPNLVARILPQTAQPIAEPSSEKSRGKKSKPKRTFVGDQTGSGEGTSTPGSSAEGNNKKKRKIAAEPADATGTGFQKQESKPDAQDEDASLSNKEFAEQFTQARSGSQLAPPSSKPGQSKKDRRANKTVAKAKSDLNSSNLSTDASSTTGADADDDLSLAGSPRIGATSDGVSKAGGVSDMLEKPSSGPSILRLTDTMGTMNKSQTKLAPKPFEVAETKKQRQARQKREAQKALNEEAEKERRKLMEKQIRGARMAEGTSNQSKVNAFKAPIGNAWTPKPDAQQGNAVKNIPAAYVEELDTRDPETKAATQTDHQTETPGDASVSVRSWSELTHRPIQEQELEAVKQRMGIGQTEAVGASDRERGPNGLSAVNGNGVEPSSSTQSNKSWADDMISEEEQLVRLKEAEQEDLWKTVPIKKEKKKAGSKDGEAKGAKAINETAVKPSNINGSPKKPTTSGKQQIESSNRFANAFGEQQDSEWVA